jgi:hypothetical protein
MSAGTITGAGRPAGKGLKSGALGLISSVVIAVSSTAPAYSMAATLGLIVGVVGVHAPAMLVVSFLPMLCIAYAFRELNKVDPDCGTTFTWTTRAFGPWAGWLGGWGIIAADIIVMASLSQIAGRYALRLVGADGLAAQTPWVTATGVLFIALLTWVCYRGHRDLGPAAAGAAGDRTGRAGDLRDRRLRPGGQRARAAWRADAGPALAEPLDGIIQHAVGLVPARGLRVLGLGLRAVGQRGDKGL